MSFPARSAIRLLAIAPLLAAMIGLGGCSLFKRDEESGSGNAAPAPTPAPAPAPAPTARVYDVNKLAEDDAAFTLTRVTVEPTATKLDLTMKGSKKAFTIAVSPPGHANAMFLETPDGKKYPFVNAIGVSTTPQRDTVKPGQSQSFTLVFAPLDPGVTTFSVFEGEDAKNPAVRKKKALWVFRQVELKDQGFAR